MKSFLINTSNLHVGGSVQVAISVIWEWSRWVEAALLDVVVSTEVDVGLRSVETQVSRFRSYRTFDVYGAQGFFKSLPVKLSAFDVVFTIFGPLYSAMAPRCSLVGFGQSWIAYPDNEAYGLLGRRERLRMRLKYWLQALCFKRADALVVELDHVKLGLVRRGLMPASRIHVVPNAVSSLYLDPSRWAPVVMPGSRATLCLGFLGRNYVHKNTRIFPAVADALRSRYGIEARFVVTFTDAEWHACTPEFRTACDNVGPLSVVQCPSFYRALDGVVFPSLLESFSVTPLEAMVMERPLFASDRPFVRDVCAEHAIYFEPLDPESIAGSIAGYFKGAGRQGNNLAAAREHALGFSTPGGRARQYLDCLLGLADSR